ncbi:STAS domain-containing protein [Planococcus wigleyi]|uniref:STAS domain-containing protein n=1 Tax=Planococcus wigleyi TaxID=2762216 RepID=A0ABR8WGV3_9BACL|nr:STAS domain-containing protein [Planococcus wigleyi]MBD8015986.1 STAS domain-containing protein [Planococcus wigleyi]
MAHSLQNSLELQIFFDTHNQEFEDSLLIEAVNVKDKIEEILSIGNIDLVTNAHKLVIYIIDGQEAELELFAKQEGIAWATHSIELSFKLEWVQAIRRTLWKFIEKFNQDVPAGKDMDFFRMEKDVNTRIDSFLNSFFLNYSTYKDTLLKAHRQLVENLSVPIIPINSTVCILPVIGAVDAQRASIIEEKVLTEIGKLQIQTLIIDLSGIAEMEAQVIHHLMKLIDGTSLMGCSTIITGLRAEVVRQMIHSGMKFDEKTKTAGTLQQALKEYLIF